MVIFRSLYGTGDENEQEVAEKHNDFERNDTYHFKQLPG